MILPINCLSGAIIFLLLRLFLIVVVNVFVKTADDDCELPSKAVDATPR